MMTDYCYTTVASRCIFFADDARLAFRATAVDAKYDVTVTVIRSYPTLSDIYPTKFTLPPPLGRQEKRHFV
jgi:hypothetical protein